MAGTEDSGRPVTDLSTALKEYAGSHTDPVNVSFHNLCVPLIFWSLFGFFHSIEVSGIPLSFPMAISTIVLYGFFRNLKVFAAMWVVISLCLISYAFVPELRSVSLVVFIIGWAGQFYGHHVEGTKPSFFKDLYFLLIGPVWVLKKVFPEIVA